MDSLAKAKSGFSALCREFRVSRSALHRWRTRDQHDRDQEAHEMIARLFIEKKERLGIKQLKMLLLSRFGVVYSRKKIARIKKKYGLITKIRKKKWRSFGSAKKIHEHRIFPNLLDRNFDRWRPDEVYSTDITELAYGEGSKAYLAVFKDLATKEIVASTLSKVANIHFTNDALKRALVRLRKCNRKALMIHSDQGLHFTHYSFRKMLRENGIAQSMSRKGNCLDNAPVESFFGYLKDHLDSRACKSYEDLDRRVTDEIKYYNYDRPQWNLKKMPPKTFRRHLKSNQAFF